MGFVPCRYPGQGALCWPWNLAVACPFVWDPCVTVPGDVLGGLISPQHALGSPLACRVPGDICPLKPVFGPLFCPTAQIPGTRSFRRVGPVALPFLGTRLACPDPRMRPWALAPALARTWRLSRPGPGGGVCYGVWTVVGIALLNMLLLPLVPRPPRCGTWGGRCQLEGPHLQFHLWPVCP